MITREQYNVIKHYQALELKKWLEENNLSFSDVIEAAMEERRITDKANSNGPFCSCCGASQKVDENHTEECIWYEGERKRKHMTIQVDREDLEILVKGIVPHLDIFKYPEHPLVKKAGYYFRYSMGASEWVTLENLTDEELYELYTICKESWKIIMK
jgi:hypothetical protein